VTRVIIVDDDTQQLDLLQSTLRGNGWDVDTAHHGVEALVMARLDPPDLIISDLLMPLMDGYTLLRTWKTDDVLRRIPFVMLAATHTDPSYERLALDLGADAFVLKSAEGDAIVELLQAVVSEPGASSWKPAPHSPPEIRRHLEPESKLTRLNEAERVLIERDREVHRTLQAAHVALWVWDVDSVAMEWPVGGKELWGGDAAVHSPRSYDEFDAQVHPDDRAALQGSLRHALATESLCEHHFRITRRDGVVRAIAARGSALEESANPHARMAGVMIVLPESR
jgi:CheY-like chemotaxis protein